MTSTQSLSMRRVIMISLVVSVMTAAAVAVVVRPTSVEAQGGASGFIRRYAANFNAFGFEISTTTPASGVPPASGGELIYDRNFFAPNDVNTAYITIAAVGDTHDGARTQLACILDDVPCNAGPNPIGGAPDGWVTVQRHKNYNDGDFDLGDSPFLGDGGGGAGDVHDNVVAYTWCTPITGAGNHNVKIRMAAGAPAETDPLLGRVFIEAAHFFIDGSRIADPDNRCTQDNTVVFPGALP